MRFSCVFRAFLIELNSKLSPQNGGCTVASGWSTNANWIRKIAGIATLYLDVNGGTLNTGWTAVATIPSGFRPYGTFDAIIVNNGSNTEPGAQVKFNASTGEIQVYKSSTVTNNLRISATYVCG